jgi:hypothetical protein
VFLPTRSLGAATDSAAQSLPKLRCVRNKQEVRL